MKRTPGLEKGTNIGERYRHHSSRRTTNQNPTNKTRAGAPAKLGPRPGRVLMPATLSFRAPPGAREWLEGAVGVGALTAELVTLEEDEVIVPDLVKVPAVEQTAAPGARAVVPSGLLVVGGPL